MGCSSSDELLVVGLFCTFTYIHLEEFEVLTLSRDLLFGFIFANDSPQLLRQMCPFFRVPRYRHVAVVILSSKKFGG